MTPWESASKEACEKAGVLGEAGKAPPGEFSHEKRSTIFRVEVCPMRAGPMRAGPMRAGEVFCEWEETSARNRKWLTPETAADETGYGDLRRLIRKLGKPPKKKSI